MGRYEAGETLASIARTYDCSPPAISYIVSRSRSRQPAAETPPVSEPQLIKVQANEAAPADGGNGAADIVVAPTPPEPPAAAPASEPRSLWGAPFERRTEDRPRDGNGFVRNGVGDRPNGSNGAMARPTVARPQAAPQPSAPFNGEQRRTLHLSLGGNGANGHSAEPPVRETQGNGASHQPQPQPSQQYQPQQQGNGNRDQPRYGFPPAASPERGFADAPSRAENDAARRKDGATFIDQELRTRVDGDIAAFLAAFDAALAGDTQESRSALREATDRLLRAGARTRIELERLEARVPLTPRDGGGRSEPAWRQR